MSRPSCKAHVWSTASVLLLMLFSASSLLSQPVRFPRETLRFSLHDRAFDFSGLYFFDNPGAEEIRRAVFYPFVRSGSFPDSVEIVEISEGKDIPCRMGKSGVTFGIDIPPYTTQSYRISFHQGARGRSLEYILTTTASWGRPLDRMTVEIEVPALLKLRRILPEPQHAVEKRGETTYTIEHLHFMPDRNLVVEWERKSQ